jgi:hypothetical protein
MTQALFERTDGYFAKVRETRSSGWPTAMTLSSNGGLEAGHFAGPQGANVLAFAFSSCRWRLGGLPCGMLLPNEIDWGLISVRVPTTLLAFCCSWHAQVRERRMSPIPNLKVSLLHTGVAAAFSCSCGLFRASSVQQFVLPWAVMVSMCFLSVGLLAGLCIDDASVCTTFLGLCKLLGV